MGIGERLQDGGAVGGLRDEQRLASISGAGGTDR